MMRTVILCVITVLCSITGTQEAVTNNKFELVLESDEFTEENLKKHIINSGIKHPQIVYAQALIETGYFTSIIFKENNNLFGMKYVKDFKHSRPRKTTAIGSKYDHAVYTHWKESVDDYLLWQQMFKKTPTEKRADYFRLLSKKYAEDPKYVVKLKAIIKKDTTRWG